MIMFAALILFRRAVVASFLLSLLWALSRPADQAPDLEPTTTNLFASCWLQWHSLNTCHRGPSWSCRFSKIRHSASSNPSTSQRIRGHGWCGRTYIAVLVDDSTSESLCLRDSSCSLYSPFRALVLLSSALFSNVAKFSAFVRPSNVREIPISMSAFYSNILVQVLHRVYLSFRDKL